MIEELILIKDCDKRTPPQPDRQRPPAILLSLANLSSLNNSDAVEGYKHVHLCFCHSTFKTIYKVNFVNKNDNKFRFEISRRQLKIEHSGTREMATLLIITKETDDPGRTGELRTQPAGTEECQHIELET